MWIGDDIMPKNSISNPPHRLETKETKKSPWPLTSQKSDQAGWIKIRSIVDYSVSRIMGWYNMELVISSEVVGFPSQSIGTCDVIQQPSVSSTVPLWLGIISLRSLQPIHKHKKYIMYVLVYVGIWCENLAMRWK